MAKLKCQGIYFSWYLPIPSAEITLPVLCIMRRGIAGSQVTLCGEWVFTLMYLPNRELLVCTSLTFHFLLILNFSVKQGKTGGGRISKLTTYSCWAVHVPGFFHHYQMKIGRKKPSASE